MNTPKVSFLLLVTLLLLQINQSQAQLDTLSTHEQLEDGPAR